MNAEGIFVLISTVVYLVGYVIVHCYAQDMKDATPATREEAINRCKGKRNLIVTIMRQSGNEERAFEVSSFDQAEREILATFRRARIDEHYMRILGDGRIEYRRMFHCHKGRHEGRKIGGAIISFA